MPTECVQGLRSHRRIPISSGLDLLQRAGTADAVGIL